MWWSSIKLRHYKNYRGTLHVGVILYWRNFFFQTLPRVNECFCPSVCISFIFLIVTWNSSQNNKEDFVDLMQVCILQATNNSWNVKKKTKQNITIIQLSHHHPSFIPKTTEHAWHFHSGWLWLVSDFLQTVERSGWKIIHVALLTAMLSYLSRNKQLAAHVLLSIALWIH